MQIVSFGLRTIIAGIFSMLISSPICYADKVDPYLIPPDVTLPTSSGSSAMSQTQSQAAPGVVTPGTSTQASSTVNPAAPAAPAVGSGGLFKASGTIDPSKPDPIAVIDTSKGQITIRLFRQLAPNTVASFIDLVTRGFYNGLTFHRVEPGFCIQGGCPKGDGSGVYIDPQTHQPRFVPLEVCPQLKHNVAGVVALARFGTSPSSGSCQFYITLGPQPSLDGKYGIFGGVLNGMNVVTSIARGDKINSISVQEQQ